MSQACCVFASLSCPSVTHAVKSAPCLFFAQIQRGLPAPFQYHYHNKLTLHCTLSGTHAVLDTRREPFLNPSIVCIVVAQVGTQHCCHRYFGVYHVRHLLKPLLCQMDCQICTAVQAELQVLGTQLYQQNDTDGPTLAALQGERRSSKATPCWADDLPEIGSPCRLLKLH